MTADHRRQFSVTSRPSSKTIQLKRRPAFIDYVRVIAPVISGVATSSLIIERLG